MKTVVANFWATVAKDGLLKTRPHFVGFRHFLNVMTNIVQNLTIKA